MKNNVFNESREKIMKLFDLEQEIMKAWHVIDDVDLLYENVIENDMATDDIANTLLGMYTIYNMRFQKVFDLFEEHCKEYHALKNEKQAFEEGNKYSD